MNRNHELARQMCETIGYALQEDGETSAHDVVEIFGRIATMLMSTVLWAVAARNNSADMRQACIDDGLDAFYNDLRRNIAKLEAKHGDKAAELRRVFPAKEDLQ